MDNDAMDVALTALFRQAARILNEMTPRERRNTREAEVVFIDIVNGKHKHDRAITFMETVFAIGRGAQPVGLILIPDYNPDKMQVKQFPDLTPEQQERLMYAFAESQDEEKELFNIEEDTDDEKD